MVHKAVNSVCYRQKLLEAERNVRRKATNHALQYADTSMGDGTATDKIEKLFNALAQKAE